MMTSTFYELRLLSGHDVFWVSELVTSTLFFSFLYMACTCCYYTPRYCNWVYCNSHTCISETLYWFICQSHMACVNKLFLTLDIKVDCKFQHVILPTIYCILHNTKQQFLINSCAYCSFCSCILCYKQSIKCVASFNITS